MTAPETRVKPSRKSAAKRLSGSTRTAILDAKRAAAGTRRPLTASPRVASSVTSGRTILGPDGDGRSAWSRRYRDLVRLFSRDLSGGDIAALSEAKRALIRRSAALCCELERLEAALSRDEAIDLASFGTATSHLRRCLETLGLERKPRSLNSEVLEAGDDFSPLRARFAETENAA